MKTDQKPEVKSRKTENISRKCSSYSAACIICSVFCILLFASSGRATEISSVTARMLNNDIYVTVSVKPDSKFIDELNEGLSKELFFYIDLFRVWKIWPDEFVIGKKSQKVLKSNPIKREYVATSLDGNVYLEKRFRDLEAMIGWTLNISDMKLTNIKELEPGTYFVKATLESRAKKLPPVVGYLLFFVSEKEFTVFRDSQTFQLNLK